MMENIFAEFAQKDESLHIRGEPELDELAREVTG